MKVYEVPYYFEHEEKIFGGYVSLRQAIYLMFAVMAIGLFFLPRNREICAFAKNIRSNLKILSIGK